MGKAGTALLYHSCNAAQSRGHRAVMPGAHHGAMITTPLIPSVDPYAGVALGVECAWPLPSSMPREADAREAAPTGAQYTVSTGTPNT
jgi:hypothetical protein